MSQERKPVRLPDGSQTTQTRSGQLLNGEMPPVISALVILACVSLFFTLPIYMICHVPAVLAIAISLVIFSIPVAFIVVQDRWKHLTADERAAERRAAGRKYIPANCPPGTIFAASLAPEEQVLYRLVVLLFPALALAACFFLPQAISHINPFRLLATVIMLPLYAIWAFSLGFNLAWRVDVRVDGLLVYTSLFKKFYPWSDVMLFQTEKLKGPESDRPANEPIIYTVKLASGGKFSFLTVFEKHYKLASCIAKHSFNAAGRGLDTAASTASIEEANRSYAKLDYLRASELYTQALSKDEFSLSALYGRGLAYIQLGEKNKAVDDLSKFIDLNDETPAAYVARGLVYEEMKKYPQAIADYGMASDLGLDSLWLIEHMISCDERLN